jgi:hypothetical protein
MSFRSKHQLPAVARGIVVCFAVALLSSLALAQSESTPKWDVFADYQWLHPGGKAPAHINPQNPVAYKIPDMSRGFGASATYNFDPHWGLETDFGRSWGKGNNVTTLSAGPRFMWRTDTASYFLHALASYNRLSVGTLRPSDGVGTILGGGMDLPVNKWLVIRLFQADYVWAHHDFFSQSAFLPELQRPSQQGVRLRTGVGLRWVELRKRCQQSAARCSPRRLPWATASVLRPPRATSIPNIS